MPTPLSGQATLPGGGQLYNVRGTTWVLYDVGGVKIAYDLTGPAATTFAPNMAPQEVDGGVWDSWRIVNGGNATELAGIRDPSYQDWLNRQVLLLTGGNAELANDLDVKRLIIERAAENISDAELSVRLRETDYWKSRTERQSQWNDLSPAEQEYQVNQVAADLVNQWFQNVGSPVSITDPTLRDFARKVASGQSSAAYVIETWIKPQALNNQESPWSRTVRSEEESQLQRGVDVENSAQQVQDLYTRWGVPYSDDVLRKWANDLTSKTASDADLQQWLQAQAAVLYPWKDKNVETRVAAEPWLQTYARVLERPAPDIFNAKIQEALVSGTPTYDFEQRLKASPEWLQTRNAVDSLVPAAAEVGRRMGFVK